ncbi:MAG: asparagine synthase (glutamine-hydrolyzing) [Deltaproteobacteria bacterium]|nr:asparagine synthase (glutamine-hydrolyzing) [Deltaproteobacteria bacterium]
MCGICGVLNLGRGESPDEGLVRRMVGSLHHRGPDENGAYLDPQVALGHTRLSIIDLAGGAQPMTNETGALWIVFNGEIFNYVELADELRARGHRFATRSDTEVILHGYEEWGDACVERFNGQWAFALWDRPRRRLLLSRDRVGVRPLYYAEHDGQLLFASEAKALFQEPALSRAFDPAGLAQVFTFWAPVAPRTPFRAVRQVRPGCNLVVEDGRLDERVYWQPRMRGPTPPADYADERRLNTLAEELRAHLETATRLRMTRSDVPVGVYLSGGIDSSVIGALVRRFHGGPLRTFSLRFANREFDEGAYQEAMVRHLATDHAVVEVDYQTIAGAFPEVIWHTETPLLRAAPAPLFSLSALVRSSGYKVVLTGEGSDELLGGYDLFREAKVRQFWARRPTSQLRPRLLERLYPWLARSPSQSQNLQMVFFGRNLDRCREPHFSHLPRWESAAALRRIFSAELQAELARFDPVEDLVASLPPEIHGWDPLGKAQYVEIVTLLSGYLLSSQGDRMLMGNSVEGRFPFLDQHVMEFANGLPPEAKLRVLDEKHLLKRAARDLVPPEILQRPKQPYRAPDAQSFVQDRPLPYLTELLSAEGLARAGLFEPVAVQRLLDKCRKSRERTPSNTDNMAVVGVLSTQLVHHQLVEGAGLASVADRDLTHLHDHRRAP